MRQCIYIYGSPSDADRLRIDNVPDGSPLHLLVRAIMANSGAGDDADDVYSMSGQRSGRLWFSTPGKIANPSPSVVFLTWDTGCDAGCNRDQVQVSLRGDSVTCVEYAAGFVPSVSHADGNRFDAMSWIEVNGSPDLHHPLSLADDADAAKVAAAFWDSVAASSRTEKALGNRYRTRGHCHDSFGGVSPREHAMSYRDEPQDGYAERMPAEVFATMPDLGSSAPSTVRGTFGFRMFVEDAFMATEAGQRIAAIVGRENLYIDMLSGLVYHMVGSVPLPVSNANGTQVRVDLPALEDEWRDAVADMSRR